MRKREKAFLMGFTVLFLLQQALFLALVSYVFQTTGKKTVTDYDDMKSELDQQILEARKKAFGMKED